MLQRAGQGAVGKRLLFQVPNSALRRPSVAEGRGRAFIPRAQHFRMSAERNRAGTVLSIPALAMIQVVHNRKIAANLSLLQIPLWWKLRRRQRSGRLELLLNRGATQIVLWMCDPSVFVGFAEQILDILQRHNPRPCSMDNKKNSTSSQPRGQCAHFAPASIGRRTDLGDLGF